MKCLRLQHVHFCGHHFMHFLSVKMSSLPPLTLLLGITFFKLQSQDTDENIEYVNEITIFVT